MSTFKKFQTDVFSKHASVGYQFRQLNFPFYLLNLNRKLDPYRKKQTNARVCIVLFFQFMEKIHPNIVPQKNRFKSFKNLNLNFTAQCVFFFLLIF